MHGSVGLIFRGLGLESKKACFAIRICQIWKIKTKFGEKVQQVLNSVTYHTPCLAGCFPPHTWSAASRHPPERRLGSRARGCWDACWILLCARPASNAAQRRSLCSSGRPVRPRSCGDLFPSQFSCLSNAKVLIKWGSRLCLESQLVGHCIVHQLTQTEIIRI